MFARLFTRLASVPFLIYVASDLGPSLFGIFSFVLATVEMVSSLSDFGLSRFGARALAREKGSWNRLAGIILSLELLFSLLLTVLGFALIMLLRTESPKLDVLLLGLVAVFLSSFVYVTETAFTAAKKFGASAVLTIIGKVIYLAGGFLALQLGFSVVAVMFAFIVGMGLECVLRMIYTLRNVTSFSFRFSRGEALNVARGTVPFAVTSLSSLVYFRADTLILEFIKGDLQVGVYSAAYSFFAFFVWAPIVLTRSLLPSLVEKFSEHPREAEQMSWYWYRLSAIASIPVAFAMTMMARSIISTLLPTMYEDSIQVLQILIWTFPLLMMVSVGFNSLTVYEKEKTGAVSSVMAAVLVVVLDLALIPFFGPIGAAIAMVATTAVWLVQTHWLMKKHLLAPVHGLRRTFGIPVAGSAAMVVAALVTGAGGPYIVLVSGLTAYGIVVFLGRWFERRALKA